MSNLADIPREQLERALGPAVPGARMQPGRARLRQLHTLARFIVAADQMAQEAAAAGIRCPAFLEMRQWAEWGIEEIVDDARSSLGLPA